jgi:hypothetical protein
MKYVLILWLCINDPSFPVNSTCIEQEVKMRFNSLQECRVAANFIYQDIQAPDIYMSSFCTQKNLTSL